MLTGSLSLAQKEVLGKHVFHHKEAFLSSVDERAKLENKVTKTDVLVNNMDWLKQFQTILSETKLLKLNQRYIEGITKSLAESKATASDAKERTTFLSVILTERKFLVNLVQSLLEKMLTGRLFEATGQQK